MAARKRPALKPRKSPRQERSQATVDAILQASAYILKRQGFTAMTTNAIAEKAGVNIASLYQYFPNKDAILVALMRQHVEEMRRKSSEVFKLGESFERRMEHGIEVALAVHRVDPELHRIFTQEALRLRLEPFETDSDASLKEGALEWIRTTKRENAALAMWVAQTAVHAVIHAAFTERPDIANDPKLAKELTKLAVRYLES